MQKRIQIKINTELPFQVKKELIGLGYKIDVEQVEFQDDPDSTGFPFKGYPNKMLDESWAQWEKRCAAEGYRTEFITPADCINDSYVGFCAKHHREFADSFRGKKDPVSLANSYLFDWGVDENGMRQHFVNMVRQKQAEAYFK